MQTFVDVADPNGLRPPRMAIWPLGPACLVHWLLTEPRQFGERIVYFGDFAQMRDTVRCRNCGRPLEFEEEPTQIAGPKELEPVPCPYDASHTAAELITDGLWRSVAMSPTQQQAWLLQKNA